MLLSNAVKYNRKHGAVQVACTSTPHHVRISIRDTGAGLSLENLALLFQPFNRLGQESGTGEGTGIGQVLARRLVELMGGSVGVTGTVGAGSKFWFELVRADMSQDAGTTGNNQSNSGLSKVTPG